MKALFGFLCDARIGIRPDSHFDGRQIFTTLRCGLFVTAASFSSLARAEQVNIMGPAGTSFGIALKILSNGNFVVRNNAALYFYQSNGTLSGVLQGQTAGDAIGSGGLVELAGGDLVVISPLWDNGAEVNAGAVTRISASAGLSGLVNASNSLIGSPFARVTPLRNGNYLVVSSTWNGNRGAVTFCDVGSACVGAVSAANSLVGSTAQNQVGSRGVVELSNGNYVVSSTGWGDGATSGLGAATWGSGDSGIVGEVSAANSLVGAAMSDLVGSNGIQPLPNGDYAVSSSFVDDGNIPNVGAVTLAKGTGGTIGPISSQNSLFGSSAGDAVGAMGVVVLANGNFVVPSSNSDSGSVADAGAVTWVSAAAGLVGHVSAANSWIGTRAGDQVGLGGITPLTNGDYVISSPAWSAPGFDGAGAVTRADGSEGDAGVVQIGNSWVGTSFGDAIGSAGVIALENGDYVIASPFWDNPAAALPDVGAATLILSSASPSGQISASNSLIGDSADDRVSAEGIVPLSSGKYLVASSLWDAPGAANAGAVTFADAAVGGIVGMVAAANSLVGSSTNDRVGLDSAVRLANANYVVRSRIWDRGSVADAGAVTWGNGAIGTTGPVSELNSLVGSQHADQVGASGVTTLINGNFVVGSALWDSGSNQDAGALTFVDGQSGMTGPVSIANSLIGSSSNNLVGFGLVVGFADGQFLAFSERWRSETTHAGALTLSGASGISGIMNSTNSLLGDVFYFGDFGSSASAFDYDLLRQRLIVGRRSQSLVTLLTLDPDGLFVSGLEY